ncbi:MAG: hypothetical protein LC104_00095 [Bacteroidales bacterium]|nr:hypothetical protein [Bacteroidales bacterium]
MFFTRLGAITAAWLIGLTVPVQADTHNLLKGMPAVDQGPLLLLVVEQPRQLAEAGRNLAAYRSATQSLPIVQEILETTRVRQFYQLVHYAEQELGAEWPTLLDQIAGGGIAIGTIAGPDQPPVLLLAQGTEESAVRAGYQLLLRIIEGEATRRGQPALRKAQYRGIATQHIGEGFHAACVGTKIYLANQEAALHAGLNTQVSRKPVRTLADLPGPTAARQLIGGEPFAWLWFDFAKVKASKQAKDFFENSRKDIFQNLLFGSTADALRRSEYLALGLSPTPTGYAVELKLPAARADLPVGSTLHVPQEPKPGSLPLLMPNGVLYSQSFYLDFGELWRKREQIINPQQRKQVEKGLADASRFVPNTSLPEMLETSGPYHRFVVVNRPEKLYATEAGLPIPAMAYVMSGCGQTFGPTVAAGFRAAALLVSLQNGLKMTEETIDGVSVVSYRFPENRPFLNDDANIRFSFVPCFATVGDTFIVSSHPGLLKDLLSELKKPAAPQSETAAVWRGRAFAQGGAEFIRTHPDQTITATILNTGVGLQEARQQVDALVAWLRTLGQYELSLDHGQKAFTLRFEWSISSPSAKEMR